MQRFTIFSVSLPINNTPVSRVARELRTAGFDDSLTEKRASHGATTNGRSTQLVVGAPYCAKATKGKRERRSFAAR
jgi:hypothetical protein